MKCIQKFGWRIRKIDPDTSTGRLHIIILSVVSTVDSGITTSSLSASEVDSANVTVSTLGVTGTFQA